MVRFTKKESEARKQLLESTNQMNDAKETENGKKCWLLVLSKIKKKRHTELIEIWLN